VTVPAEVSAVQILRTMAMAMAPSGMDIDRLDDLALAVGETAVELLGLGAGPGAPARARMTIDRVDGAVEVTLSVQGPQPAGWASRWERSVSAQVLGVLATGISTETGPEESVVSFRFVP
jgi:hypothetical protein